MILNNKGNIIWLIDKSQMAYLGQDVFRVISILWIRINYSKSHFGSKSQDHTKNKLNLRVLGIQALDLSDIRF